MSEQYNTNDFLQRLEEKITFLERHIEVQDREIYYQSEQLQHIAAQLKLLQTQFEGMKPDTEMPGDEKPPHY